MTPIERYKQDLAQTDFVHDSAQELAVTYLEALYQRLLATPQATPPSTSWLNRLGISWNKKAPKKIEKGLYFWGGVGRGKTYLMDTFYECLPFDNKLRTHFYRFMRDIHQQLKELDGTPNPLTEVATRYAQRYRIICFDEFFVTDITDAMILARLLEGLFDQGVVLVATSNINPDGLYKDGLQRVKFLPAIELLKTHTEVLNIDGGVDYRLRVLEQAELYHCPLDDTADASLLKSFNQLSYEQVEHFDNTELNINQRPIKVRKLAGDVAWFDFPDLCEGPRSQNDYIEIANQFHSVILSNVPSLGIRQEDAARRFIMLVDELYDNRVKLIISAQNPIHEIYSGQRLKFEIERTKSRLLEMQSHDYLACSHKDSTTC